MAEPEAEKEEEPEAEKEAEPEAEAETEKEGEKEAEKEAEKAEENGEDLQDADCQKLSDDDEDDLAEQEAAKGFIVDDDYLSVSEMNYSFESDMANNDALLQADLQRRKAILEKKRQNELHLKNRSLSEGP